VATSNDHPGLPFVQAQGYTKGRPDGPPLWIVWHSMEASEHSARAESTAAYFANPSDGRAVSAHLCGDDNSDIQCVDEDDSAWTVGNRPGNYRGVNIELAGFARQSRADWLDPFGRAMFARLAPIVAASMTRWHIPNRWCTVADLKAHRPGHTTHNDLREAFGGTTHTDPGAGFPRDHVLRVVAAALNPEASMPKLIIVTDEEPPNKVCVTDYATRRWLTPKQLELVMAATGLPFPGDDDRVTSALANDTYGPDLTTIGGGGAVLVPHDHDVVIATGPARPTVATG